MRKPVVSIIIPTYNRLDFLKESVVSVLKQTFSDYELIISDNCSNDGTKEWVRSLLKKNHKIRYYRNKKNLGMVGNWNKGISYAKGKYISILMDDDSWHKDFLIDTIKVLDNKPKIGVVCVHFTPIYTKDVSGKDNYPNNMYKLFNRSREVKGIDCIKQYLISTWLVGLPSAILVRKKCFEELGKFDEICLDPEMWLRICSRYNFYYLDKLLCYWKVHNLKRFTSKLRFIDSVRHKFHTLNKIFAYSICQTDLLISSLKKQVYQKLRKEVITEWILGRRLSIWELIAVYKLYLSIPILILDIISFSVEVYMVKAIRLLYKFKLYL